MLLIIIGDVFSAAALAIVINGLGIEHVDTPLVYALPVGTQLGEARILLLGWCCIICILAILRLYLLVIIGALGRWILRAVEAWLIKVICATIATKSFDGLRHVRHDLADLAHLVVAVAVVHQIAGVV